MPYEFLEDVALADIAFKAWGESLEETFVASADAVMNAMVEDLDTIRPEKRRELRIGHEALDLLLFNFLQELIFYKDSEQLLLRVPEVRIAEEDRHYSLYAMARGELLDPERHHLRVDVKAVTLHHFSLKRVDHRWEAFVILDI